MFTLRFESPLWTRRGHRSDLEPTRVKPKFLKGDGGHPGAAFSLSLRSKSCMAHKADVYIRTMSD